MRWIRANPTRGVCGYYDMNNPNQEAWHFPDNGFDDLQAPSLKRGVPVLLPDPGQRAQDRLPDEISESKLKPAPWWT